MRDIKHCRKLALVLLTSLLCLGIVGCAQPEVVIKTKEVKIPVKSQISKEIYDYALEPPFFYKDNEAKTIHSLHEKYLRLRKVFINTITYYEVEEASK